MKVRLSLRISDHSFLCFRVRVAPVFPPRGARRSLQPQYAQEGQLLTATGQRTTNNTQGAQCPLPLCVAKQPSTAQPKQGPERKHNHPQQISIHRHLFCLPSLLPLLENGKVALLCPSVSERRVCQSKGCGNVKLRWQQTQQRSEAHQDGRYEPQTANKPPRLREPHHPTSRHVCFPTPLSIERFLPKRSFV